MVDFKSQQNVPTCRSQRSVEVVCYNYQQKGHIQPKCTEPAHCYGCKDQGHIKKDCPIASVPPISSAIPANSPNVRGSNIGDEMSNELAQRLISSSPRSKVKIKNT